MNDPRDPNDTDYDPYFDETFDDYDPDFSHEYDDSLFDEDEE